jgi:hypothetical protein
MSRSAVKVPSLTGQTACRQLLHLATALAVCLPAAPLLAGPAWAASSKSWTVQPTPSPGKRSTLQAVSCASPSACIAVGSSFPASAPSGQALAERWNGTAWKIQPVAAPAGATGATLDGVSCPAPSTCAAAGSYQASSGAQESLAERWNGTTWVIQRTPNPRGDVSGVNLTAISCPAVSACTAVGVYTVSSGAQKTLAEHWNGTTWAIQPTPNAGGDLAALNAVSCPSLSACTAAGTHLTSSGAQKTLAEHWNGTTWAIQPTPNPAGDSPVLAGVSCAAATTCTATGTYDNSAGHQKTLAERWNGTSWAIQPTASPAGTFPALLAVSCLSSAACTATGTYDTAHGWKTLAEHWNGNTWTVQPTPDPAGDVPTLTGVSCLPDGSCAAAGDYQPSPSGQHTLAERYGP